jgi:putative peptide zinc metalloprotease protein
MARYAIVVTFIKIFHELSHAYVAKGYGVRVRRMGIAFIFFFPRLYTDITDSWRIKSKNGRLLVDAAGIICEVIIGGIAALLWNPGEDSMFNILLFYIFTSSIISTIFINGNPFLRYDGYYFLMDFLEIDNMYQKGRQHSNALFRKVLWGINSNIKFNKKEILLSIYGISGFIYRIFLYTSLVLVVYYKFKQSIGLVLMLLEIYLLIFKPLIMEVRQLLYYKRSFNKLRVIFTLLVFSGLVYLLFTPLPLKNYLPAEIKHLKSERIKANESGFSTSVFKLSYKTFSKGEKILELKNPFLEMKLKKKQQQLTLYRAEYKQLILKEETLASAKTQLREIKRLESEVELLKDQISELKFISHLKGYFISKKILEHSDNHWIQKGSIIGELYPVAKNRNIIAYVDAGDINWLKEGTKVKFYLPDSIKSYDGTVEHIGSAPTITFSKASPLLSIFSGVIHAKKVNGKFRVNKPLYKIKVLLDDEIPANQVGRSGTLEVTKHQAIITLIWGKVRNFFLQEFAI